MKRYLLTMLILLLTALSAGIGVWYAYQDLNPIVLQERSETGDSGEVPDQALQTQESVKDGGLTISSESLTPAQRDTLKAFGVEGDLLVSDAMLACAEKEIGTERFQEILHGAAPTPFEALVLAPCLRAE